MRVVVEAYVQLRLNLYGDRDDGDGHDDDIICDGGNDDGAASSVEQARYNRCPVYLFLMLLSCDKSCVVADLSRMLQHKDDCGLLGECKEHYL